MAKDILLKSFSINDFGIIDHSKPILLYLEDAYKEGRNITIASGDQGTGKSTWLTALQGLLCVNLGVKEENFVNKTSGKINTSFEFDYKDVTYRVTWTKSAFKLQKKEYNELTEREVWRDELSPVATLQKIIGYVGTSPMLLKTSDGATQVQRIRKALSAPKEVEEQEKKLLTAFEAAKNSRTNANREYTRLLKSLEGNELYTNWEVSEETFKEEKSSEGEKKKMKELEIKNNQFSLAQQKIIIYNQNIAKEEADIKDFERQIAEMKERLELKKADLKKSQESKVVGEKWLEENKAIVQEYAQAQEDFQNIERYLVNQAQWKSVKKQKAEMDEYSDLVIKADSTKDGLKQQLLEIGKQGLPDIEGLEVITTNAIEGKEIGVYLNGMNVYQLSESELWGLFLKIWGTQGVKYITVENVSNLGSQAIDILNDLAKQGVKIFATELKRKEPFKIVITDKII